MHAAPAAVATLRKNERAFARLNYEPMQHKYSIHSHTHTHFDSSCSGNNVPNNNRVEMLPNRTKFTNESHVIVTAFGASDYVCVCVCILIMNPTRKIELIPTAATTQTQLTRLLTSYLWITHKFCFRWNFVWKVVRPKTLRNFRSSLCIVCTNATHLPLLNFDLNVHKHIYI